MKSCESDVAPACFNLALLYERGDTVAQSDQHALQRYQQACALNHALSCNNAGYMHQAGRGTPANAANASKAFSYYQKSCELNEGIGCYNVGLQYYNGTGAPQNTNLAKQYLRKSCDLAYEDGCKDYALLAEN